MDTIDSGTEASHISGAAAATAPINEPGRATVQMENAKGAPPPENGLKGLKHWRQDMLAGLIVALVSVPLSLGIALASGAPPIAGLTSEIIAGLIFPFLGGAFVTISGPAAGLAPVLFVSITALGHGDMTLGYHRVLAVILLVGIVQLGLTVCGAAKFSYVIPSSAIRGMLCSIGLLIIGKQIPNMLGTKFHAHDFWPTLAELPRQISHAEPAVLAIGVACLALLFGIPKLNWRALRFVPPQLIVVLVGIAAGQFAHLNSKFLVHIPDNPLAKSFVMPDFASVLADPGCWSAALIAVLALTLVDGTESLATIHAVDKIDPFKRKSQPKRALFAMGISNICSSMIGGLTIIPGIIKSTTCILSGGRTAWVNFYNALFLISFLVFATAYINMIPIAALAAVLMHIGYKLAGPKVWQSVASVGREQLLVMSVTVLVTLSSDLLIGIIAGVITKVAVLAAYTTRTGRKGFASNLASLFRSPVTNVDTLNGVTTITLAGPITCFNTLPLRAAVDAAYTDATVHTLRITAQSGVTMLDHSCNSYLHVLESDFKSQSKILEIDGLKKLRPITSNAECMRYRLVTS